MNIEFLKVCSDVTKTAKKIPQSQYLSNGRYPIFDQGQKTISGYSNDVENTANDFPYIVFGDHTRILKYVDKPCYIGADGVKLIKIINDDFDTKYVFYALLANPIKSHGYSRHFKLLKKKKIKLASKKEQCFIVKKLDSIKELIASKENELKLFDDVIKSRFIEMFSEVSNKQMLSALTIKITDGSHNPPKGIEKSNYLMLSSQNVYDKLVLNDVRYLSKEDFNFENKRTNIQNGDVLLTIVGTVGRTYVVRNDEKYVFQRSVAVIKPIDGVLDGIYLSAYLKTEEAINQLEAGAHGSSQKGIYLNNLKKLVIPVADFSKQLTFKSFVNQVDKSKFIYHSKYFLCDIFTLFSSTIAYSSVVSIFACPNIFCTCSIGIPLSIAFVANVLLNL